MSANNALVTTAQGRLPGTYADVARLVELPAYLSEARNSIEIAALSLLC